MNSTLYPGKRLLNLQEFSNYTGLGKTKGKEWAGKYGAIRHIGRRILFDRVIIDKVLSENKEE